jgi:hypothetical protein
MSARGERSKFALESLERRQLLSVSLAGAINTGTLAGRSVYADSLSSGNTSDVRKITLASSGTLNLSLSGLAANADLQLIKDSNNNLLVDLGETLATSANAGTAGESITRALAAGTYYVRVYRNVSTTTNYTLTLKMDGAGGSLGNARNIGTLAAPVSFKDYVGADDSVDLYKFTLSRTKPFTASLSRLSADANLQLIRDANGNGIIDAGETLSTSAKIGTSGESIIKALPAGTYYARVYRGSGDTNYSLGLSPVGHLNIVFDYRYDTSGFFASHPAAKDRLVDAAAYFSILGDNLSGPAAATLGRRASAIQASTAGRRCS